MAYIDQDRSRERLISGTVSAALVGAIGFALASGLAERVVMEKVWRIPSIAVREAPPPPPPRPQPQPRAAASHEAAQTVPNQIEIPLPPMPDLPPVALDPGQNHVFDTGGTGSGPVTQAQTEPAKPNLSIGAVPKGHPGDWVNSDDYPPSAERAGLQGHSGFRLGIGTDGRPTDCTITRSSGSAELDATACRLLMRRARFTPARGADGQPVVSSYGSTVDWRLPGE